MTNKIDSSTPMSGRPALPAEIERAGTERSNPTMAASPVSAPRLDTDKTSLQVTMPPSDEPVMDHARIQAVRTALANGSYRIDPQEIAARLDALEQELSR